MINDNNEPNLEPWIRENTIFISRGRNQSTNTLVGILSTSDYNYDYRGDSAFYNIVKAYINSKEVPFAKFYICEGLLCSYVGFFLKRKYPSTKLICYLNGPDLYRIKRGEGLINKIKFFLKKIIIKRIDVFLCISKKVESDLISLGYKINTHVVGCFSKALTEYHYENQNNLRNLREDIYLFGGDRPKDTSHIKGLDVAVSLFLKIKESKKNSKLFIIGRGTEQLKYTDPDIKCLGRVDPGPILLKTKYLFATSRYDALNMLVLEGIACGVLPIISINVGASEIFSPNFSKYIAQKEDLNHYLTIFNKYELLQANEKEYLLTELNLKLGDYSSNTVIKKCVNAMKSMIAYEY